MAVLLSGANVYSQATQAVGSDVIKLQLFFLIDGEDAMEQQHLLPLKFQYLGVDGASVIELGFNRFSVEVDIPRSGRFAVYAKDADLSNREEMPNPLFEVTLADGCNRSVIVAKYLRTVGGALSAVALDLSVDQYPEDCFVFCNMSARTVMLRVGEYVSQLEALELSSVTLAEIIPKNAQAIQLAVQSGSEWRRGYGTQRRIPTQGRYFLLFSSSSTRNPDFYNMHSMRF